MAGSSRAERSRRTGKSSHHGPSPCSPDSSSANPHALKNYPTIISMKLRYQGFIAMDYTSRYGEAAVYLADLVSRGKMAYEYTILSGEAGQNGLGRCVEGMDVVSSGKNVGKTSVW